MNDRPEQEMEWCVEPIDGVSTSDPRVEAAARAIVRHQFQGCVSWQDTTDTATTGDEMTRRRALDLARDVLAAVDASPAPDREKIRAAILRADAEWDRTVAWDEWLADAAIAAGAGQGLTPEEAEARERS